MGSFTNRKQIVTLDICLSVSSIQLNHLRSLLSACPSFSHTVGINFSPSWVWDWFVKTLMNGILKKSLEFLKVEEAQIRFENKLCFVNFRKLANGKVLCVTFQLSDFRKDLDFYWRWQTSEKINHPESGSLFHTVIQNTKKCPKIGILMKTCLIIDFNIRAKNKSFFDIFEFLAHKIQILTSK